MISKDLRCVFVHIPRTGGTSIEKALGWIPDGAVGPYQTVPHGSQDHRRVGEFRSALSAADFAGYFKFTFVRNPWDRAVSWYKVVLKDPVHLKNLNIPADCSFRDFLLAKEAVWGLQPQLYWIREPDGGIPLDFIGRFENLKQDYAQVCERLGIRDPDLPHLIEARDKRPYPTFYDAELQTLVGQRYAEEIDLFGYRFGA
jgi:hypothetical protein